MMTGWIRHGMLLFLIALQVPTSTNREPVSVCEVLNDLPKYSGSLISVRGEWVGGALVGKCKPLRTQNFIWLNQILVELPENLSDNIRERVDWELNQDALNQA